MNRPQGFDGARRVVIKIGSAVLRDGQAFDRVAFASIVRGLAALIKEGLEPVVVCSGAIALGLPRLGITERPQRMEKLQAAAAVGQSLLMQHWSEELAHYGLVPAQVLLTHDGLKDRSRFLAARYTLRSLLEMGAIPIVNENDTVATEEIKLGDNDFLSSQIVGLIEAQMLVILSNVDGLYNGHPDHPDSFVIDRVDGIEDEIRSQAGTSTSTVGSGGMVTKLEAIHQVNQLGAPGVIAPGKKAGVLQELWQGSQVGTWFACTQPAMGHRKHWIAYAANPKGSIHLDAGAAQAILESGRSLLPIGITRVEGNFELGETVSLINPDGIEIARGLSGCDAATMSRAAGLRSEALSALGLHRPEVIHRDDLVILHKDESLTINP